METKPIFDNIEKLIDKYGEAERDLNEVLSLGLRVYKAIAEKSPDYNNLFNELGHKIISLRDKQLKRLDI